ncbi:hypothetical protein [Paraburkholderia fungorum]|uniref:hypothetical protein n=1 Tax=Paraburkholderia fungorum TaxID=134537 RepID=UPI00160B3759|nr:hypothetical protein [Paraburkholderia fungorum]MBB5546549.1 hypothetical protein [Paraburkholderia fungorum]
MNSDSGVNVGLTDQEVVDGAERMARVLLQAWGFQFSGAAVRTSGNPRAISAWDVVTKMLEEYNGTDLVSAIAAIDSDASDSAPVESPVTAFERKVNRALQAATGLQVVFSSMLQERSKHNAVYHAHSGQQATIVGVGVNPDLEQDWDEETLPFLRVRFEDGVEVAAFGEELFSNDERFFALYSAVLGGYGAARDLSGRFVGPYHLALEGSDADKRAYVATLNTMPSITECDQAPWTPLEFRVSGNGPDPTA